MTERERILEHAQKQLKHWQKVVDNYSKEFNSKEDEVD